MKFINLNGPAFSGKDALAKEIAELVTVDNNVGIHVEFKGSLIDLAIRIAGINRELWDALYHRDYKEVPQPYFNVAGKQVSPRNWLIHISENVAKPLFGEDYFGVALAKRVKDIAKSMEMNGYTCTFISSDGGFVHESVPVVKAVNGDYTLIRLHRTDPRTGNKLTFEGDSRNYIYSENFPESARPKDFDVENVNGKLTETAKLIIKLSEGKE